MKPTLPLLAVFVANVALAQVQLDLGGTGAYGPLNVTADTTIPLPADGVLHVTTMTVASGATLRFTPNARNTPVTIVATGDVLINGVIDVNGSPGTAGLPGIGGPGGVAGGAPVLTNYNDRHPSGLSRPAVDSITGGQGGGGSYANAVGSGTCTVLGAGGSGGGGGISIRSNTAIRSMTAGALITAAGGTASTILPTNPSNPSLCLAQNQGRASPGSEGYIRLIAPIVEGSSLSLVGSNPRIERLSGSSTPTAQNQTGTPLQVNVGSSMAAYSAPLATPRIVSIDGTMLPAGANSYQFTYTPAATSTTIVTNVVGCPGSLTAGLSVEGFIGTCLGDQTMFNSVLNATTTWSCPLAASTISTGRVLFYATCNEP